MECFPRGPHIRWLNLAIILGILSLLAFDLYQGLSGQPMIPSEGCGLGLSMNRGYAVRLSRSRAGRVMDCPLQLSARLSL
jgi:hypothetical protein